MKPWPETHVAVGFDLAWQHRRAAEDRQDQQWSKSTPTYLCFQYFMDQHWITKTCHHKTADFLFLIDICWTGITQNSYVLLNLWKHIYTNWIPPPHQCFISQNAEETVMRSHVCTRSKVLQWTLWSVLYSRVNTPPQCFIYCRCFSCETKQQWQTRRTKCLNQRGSDAMTL